MKTRAKPILPLAAVIGLQLIPASVTAQTPNRAHLDRDGIPNMTDPGIDNDGIPNGLDRNIDGETARSGPLRSSSMRLNTFLFSS